MLLGIGNPLLDLTVNGNAELLKKYNLRENDAIIAGDAQKSLYADLMENFDVKFTAGGSVQNSLRVCQWILKKPNICIFMGSVGKDKYSEILKTEATADGVNVIYQYQDKVPTGTCAVIITTHQGNTRSLCANLAAAERFTIDHIRTPENRKYVEQANFFYISGFFLTVSPDTAYEIGKYAATKNKVFITNLSAPFICDAFSDRVMKTLPYVDIVFGNESEALTFSRKQKFGTTDLKDILLKIKNLPKENKNRSRMVIITQGHHPVLLAKDNEVLELPVPPIPKELILDTNGAGDAFVGGFLSQFIQGKTLEKCIECANWAAAHIIQNSGCSFDKSISFAG
ncbi:UNVERIFIED_CONTAM: hypothetical protein PYX00_002649 [Menopon gallinae]|uniref:Adenosine kinase n=1 Tax=Menopon gallinae TaxID=328185 RepID=A0AAW2HXM6_9NEOP